MSWTVYLAECADGSLYCGITNDIERRLHAHNAGTGARYTRSRRPVRLAWSEPASSRGAALKRERAVKSLTRAAKLALIAVLRT
ncbi:MAG: GIY-YIG nuclease family protein [Candidatus Thermoplasmatota archaeon]